jgi:hypothetical protein
MAAEKNLENALRARIRAVGGWEVKIHGDQWTAGIPDLLACYKGHFLGLEVKAPTGHPSELQLQRIRMIRLAGGIAEVIYNMELLDEIIATIDRNETWEDRQLRNSKTVLRMDKPPRRVELQSK